MRRDIGLSGPIYALFIVEKPKKKVDSSIKALNKDHAFALLEKMNFPFIKKGDN